MLEIMVLGLFTAALLLSAVFGVSVLYALIFGYFVFAGYALIKHNSLAEVLKMSFNGVKTVKNVLIVFMLIGMLTALWRAAGTIPFLVVCTSGLIVPSAFILFIFLLNCFVSVLTGTSLGTAATSGVISMAMAAAAGVNPVYAGGAVLSGIYFGDRCSPMSTSALLVSELTGTDIFDNIRNMIRTSVVPFIAVCAIYLTLGMNGSGASPDGGLLTLLKESFNLHWLAALPAGIVIILSLFRVRVKKTMIISILMAGIISIVLQGVTLPELFSFLFTGYRIEEPGLAAMMNGGGLLSMVKVSAIICISSSYSGIFEKTGILQGVKQRIGRLGQKITPYGGELVTSLVASMAACNQTLGIILTYQLCKDMVYDRRKMALYLENTAVIVAPLVPWSVACAAPMAAISAVNVGGCILFAFYIYLLPAWNLFRNRKRREGSVYGNRKTV